MSFINAAEEALSLFGREKRDDGTEYYFVLYDDSWVYEAVRQAHGGRLPDDWVYNACHSFVCDASYGNVAFDNLSEWAVSEVDVYAGDLLRWLADGWLGVVDEYRNEYGKGDSILDDIRGGQYLALLRIAEAMCAAIQNRAEEMKG